MQHNISLTPLLGHEEEMRHAMMLAKRKEMPHAWMFCGEKGIGKSQFAKNFSAFLLMNFSFKKDSSSEIVENIFSDPSLQHHIENNTHGDLCILQSEEEESKKNLITTDTIRNLRHFTSLTSSSSYYRIVIIDNIDSLHPASSNALLKQIEEPSPGLLWFLISHRPENVLPTLKSRCRKIQLRPIGPDVMRVFLKTQFPLSTMPEKIILISQGSIELASYLAGAEWYPLYQKLLENLVHLPQIHITALEITFHLFTASERNWSLLVPFFSHIFYQILRENNFSQEILEEKDMYRSLKPRLSYDMWYKTWRDTAKLIEEGDFSHLDRKAVFFSIFSKIAKAMKLYSSGRTLS